MHYRWRVICILEKKAHYKNSLVVGERKYKWIHALSVCGGMAKRKEWKHEVFLLGRVDRWDIRHWGYCIRVWLERG